MLLSSNSTNLTSRKCSELQIFNEFNARKPDEKNIFKGITTNHLFMMIVALTLVLQVRFFTSWFNSLGLLVLCSFTFALYYIGCHHRISRQVYFNCEAQLEVLADFYRHWFYQVSCKLFGNNYGIIP